jgi:type I restriction enzyme S subunit
MRITAAKQSTRDYVSLLAQRELRLFLPPRKEQSRITAFLDRETAKLDALMAKVREGIEKLKEYLIALISAAVTGKIDVREAV